VFVDKLVVFVDKFVDLDLVIIAATRGFGSRDRRCGTGTMTGLGSVTGTGNASIGITFSTFFFQPKGLYSTGSYRRSKVSVSCIVATTTTGTMRSHPMVIVPCLPLIVAVCILERASSFSLPVRSQSSRETTQRSVASFGGGPSPQVASRWGRCTVMDSDKRSSTAVFMGSAKNWDAILAEEEQDPGFKSTIPADMMYNKRNCERCNKNNLAIKAAGGPAADLYGCVSTDNQEAVFWFLGKVAHVSDVSLEQCVARQWPMIQQHAANLRPIDLFPAVSSKSLELWCAPADSEFDVAYNRPSCVFQKMESDVPGAAAVKANMIGFQGEVYDRGEEGFRTWRLTDTGMPSRPEVTGPKDDIEYDDTDDDDDEGTRAPTDEEMKQIQKALEGKDINDVYEAQEQRRKEAD
jgi:hypothetical protein